MSFEILFFLLSIGGELAAVSLNHPLIGLSYHLLVELARIGIYCYRRSRDFR